MNAPDEDEIDYGDDDDDDDDDDDEEDDDEDGGEPEHEEGRRWQLISKTADSITRAMEVRKSSTTGPPTTVGCLVRVETYGAEDGEYSSSVTFIHAVDLSELQIETHPEPDAEPGNSSS